MTRACFAAGPGVALRGPRALELVERDDLQLGWRAAEELPDQHEVVRVLGRQRRLGSPCLRDAGRELDRSARPRRHAPRGGYLAACQEIRTPVPDLPRGNEQAQLRAAQPVETRELRAEGLDGRDPVAQARRVLEAKRLDVG